MQTRTLETYLEEHLAGSPYHEPVARLISSLAEGAHELRDILELGALGAGFAGEAAGAREGGDVQKKLDVVADDIFLRAARQAGVCAYASEELDQPVLIDRSGPLVIAIDPLDGSSNIETNVTIGTIFSVLPTLADPSAEVTAQFLRPGTEQVASGFFVYGGQLALVLSVGEGTSIFLYSRSEGFLEVHRDIQIPKKTTEFAINMSNYRHWDTGIRSYVDACLKGAEGDRGKDFNMRWIASAVADVYRIMVRGGIYLYPGDARRGYGRGRLRLVYEAAPIAMLIEQAGGLATDGKHPILQITPTDLHQRSALIFGSAAEVECVVSYVDDPRSASSPLFAQRGLFRN